MSRPEKPWPAQPARCTCTRLTVATLEETLACPDGWYYVPLVGWVHSFDMSPAAAR